MTCVVGIEHKSGVWIGADSATVADDFDIAISAIDKVFFMNEQKTMLVGFSGSWRAGQIVQHCMSVPEHNLQKSDEMWLVNEFVHTLRESLREHGCMKTESGEDSSVGDFLVGYRGKLWNIQDDYQISRYTTNYAAIGCGSKYALGALAYLTEHKQNMTPREMIKAALEATTRHNAAVQPPYKILQLVRSE